MKREKLSQLLFRGSFVHSIIYLLSTFVWLYRFAQIMDHYQTVLLFDCDIRILLVSECCWYGCYQV